MKQLISNKPMTAEEFTRFTLKNIEKKQINYLSNTTKKNDKHIFLIFPAAHKKLMQLACRIARKEKMNEYIESRNCFYNFLFT